MYVILQQLGQNANWQNQIIMLTLTFGFKQVTHSVLCLSPFTCFLPLVQILFGVILYSDKYLIIIIIIISKMGQNFSTQPMAMLAMSPNSPKISMSKELYLPFQNLKTELKSVHYLARYKPLKPGGGHLGFQIWSLPVCKLCYWTRTKRDRELQ